MNKERSTSARAFRYFDQTYNLVANFNRTFNEKHTVNAMAGVEYYKRQYKNLQGSGSKAVTDEFGNLQYTFNGTQSPYAGSTRSMATNYANEAILSYFARAEYDYDDKYLIAATLRQDGYSRLQDNRWGTFPVYLPAGYSQRRISGPIMKPSTLSTMPNSVHLTV